MFSLQVGLNDGTVPMGRLFEHTEPHIRATLESDVYALQSLPVLAMPEVGDGRFDRVARIGNVSAVKPEGRGHRFSFVPSPRFIPIPLSTIERLAGELGIGDWELQRTHWAVKDADLFEVLLADQMRAQGAGIGQTAPPGAVQFPRDTPRDPKLVTVMMPFAAAFDIVYETIEAAASEVGLRCVRADTIWEADHVMADVLSILWRSQIVVADLTGKNANVFYETGLAHALPRPTVLLTQDAADVPFDLQSIRYLRYGVGKDERAVLRTKLAQRLDALSKQPC
jgi:hypothetical protein